MEYLGVGLMGKQHRLFPETQELIPKNFGFPAYGKKTRDLTSRK